MQVCSIPECGRPVHVKSRGWCQRHYARWWKYGDPLAYRKPQRGICSIEGCELTTTAKGLCDLHYRRQKRYGTTERPPRPVVCSAGDCTRPVAALGMCDMHYRRVRAGGEAEPDRSCRQCGGSLAGLNIRRMFCSTACKEHWMYWERRTHHRARWLKQYGLTEADYESLLEAQGGVCAICGTDNPGSNGNQYWCVDHDHKTGTVRGLLCRRCNVGLGHFQDDPQRIERAIAYLQR